MNRRYQRITLLLLSGLAAALSDAVPIEPFHLLAQDEAQPKRNIAGPGDYALRERLIGRIGRDPVLTQQGLKVVLVNGGAVFSGQVSNCAVRMRALTLAAFTRGIVNVTDEMVVAPADLSDRALRKVLRQLLADMSNRLGLVDLHVEVRDSVATLTGTTEDYRARVEAERIAGTVFGITRISNHLIPANVPRVTDEVPLVKAVVKYLADYRDYPYIVDLRVIEEDGLVTLTGRVTFAMARQQAAVMASLVEDVEEVVNEIRVDPSFRARRAVIKAGDR